MNHRRSIPATLALLLAGSWPAVSRAGGPPQSAPTNKPSVVPTEDATVWGQRGVELFHAAQYDAARDAFSRALALDPQPETLLDLGIVEVLGDHPVEASAHLREYLSHTDQPANKLDAVRAKWLPQAEAHTARLEVWIAAGAEVLVDGVPQKAGANLASGGDHVRLSIVTTAGAHEVRERYGATEQVRHVVAHDGDLLEVHFESVPAASSAASPISSGATPRERPDDTIHRAPDSGSRAKWITVIGLGSIAVLSAGAAIGFRVASDSSAADSNRLAQNVGRTGCRSAPVAVDCPALNSARESAQNNAALATGFIIGASSAAVLAASAWLLWPAQKGSPVAHSLRAAPLLGERSTGIVFEGAW